MSPDPQKSQRNSQLARVSMLIFPACDIPLLLLSLSCQWKRFADIMDERTAQEVVEQQSTNVTVLRFVRLRVDWTWLFRFYFEPEQFTWWRRINETRLANRQMHEARGERLSSAFWGHHSASRLLCTLIMLHMCYECSLRVQWTLEAIVSKLWRMENRKTVDAREEALRKLPIDMKRQTIIAELSSNVWRSLIKIFCYVSPYDFVQLKNVLLEPRHSQLQLGLRIGRKIH